MIVTHCRTTTQMKWEIGPFHRTSLCLIIKLWYFSHAFFKRNSLLVTFEKSCRLHYKQISNTRSSQNFSHRPSTEFVWKTALFNIFKFLTNLHLLNVCLKYIWRMFIAHLMILVCKLTAVKTWKYINWENRRQLKTLWRRQTLT